MNELARWQAAMANAVLAGSAEHAAGLLSRISEDERADRKTRLAVYADAYRLRGLEVLADDFAALVQTLGSTGFERLALGYLAVHRSTDPSIRWLGKDFAAYLDSRGEAAWMADLARFCWAMGEAHDAADSDRVGARVLAELPPASWPNVTLRFPASFRLLSSRFDVATSWQQAEDRENCRNPPTRLPQPVTWAIWRQTDGQVLWQRVADAGQAGMLSRAQQGQNLAQLAQSLHSSGIEPARAASILATSLRSWLQAGWLSGLEMGS